MRIKIQIEKKVAYMQAYSNDRREKVALATNERDFVSRETLKEQMGIQVLEVADKAINNFADRVNRQSYKVKQEVK